MLDFVGQLGPTSKIRLTLLDFTILALQLITLSATLMRRGLAKALKDSRPNQSNEAAPSSSEPPTAGQDHDAEERGVLRRPSISSATGEAGESEAMLRDDGADDQTSDNTHDKSDLLWSGQSLIAELYIWDTIKEAPRATSAISPELQAQLQRNRWQLNLPFRS